MPSWLISLLSLVGPKLLIWALALVEQKYPGLTPIVQQIINFIDASPNPPAAIAQVQAHLEKLTSPTPAAPVKS